MSERGDQLGLFGQPTEAESVSPSEQGASLGPLADRLSSLLRFGTSSWTFPGWGPLVYASDDRLTERTLARRGLNAYASHPLHRTVGLDRAFYKPLTREEYQELAEQTPDGFRFVIKAWQAVTRPDADERGRTHGDTLKLRASGQANRLFLDPEAATDLVIAPAVLGLCGQQGSESENQPGDRLGPIVFQFPPLDLGRTGPFGGVMAFIDGLASFLRVLPTQRAPIAVELRDRAFFELDPLRELTQVLRDLGVSLSLAHHPALPHITEQRELLARVGYDVADQPMLVCRWLLRHGETYNGAKQKYQPFDRLVDADTQTRGAIARACLDAIRLGRAGYVIVNNKAEGSAPISIERLAQQIAYGAPD